MKKRKSGLVKEGGLFSIFKRKERKEKLTKDKKEKSYLLGTIIYWSFVFVMIAFVAIFLGEYLVLDIIFFIIITLIGAIVLYYYSYITKGRDR